MRVPHRLPCGYLLHHGASQSACGVLSTSSHFLSFTFFSPSLAPVQCFLTFLECFFREVSLAGLMGSAMSCDMSVVEWHRAVPVLFPWVPPLQPAHSVQIQTHICCCAAFQSVLQFTVNLFQNFHVQKQEKTGLLPNIKQTFVQIIQVN